MEEKLLKIINHYGIKNQVRKFDEESYELIEAILDFNCGNNYAYGIEHITEEIADVMVMLEQFKLYYNISSEEITEIFWSKVNRQLKRIEEEK